MLRDEHSSGEALPPAKAAELDDYHTHYLHCIDYLRQAVMCAGDTALEPHSANDGKDLGPLDGGWNGIHGKRKRREEKKKKNERQKKS